MSADIDGQDEEQLRYYVGQAHGLIALVADYEDEHPKGSPCFFEVLEAMKAAVV